MNSRLQTQRDLTPSEIAEGDGRARGGVSGAARSADGALRTAQLARAIIVNPAQSLLVNPARYVLLPLANVMTGYSVKAMQRKIERGDWLEGKVWRRAPDGHILIDMQGYQKWVESH